MYNRLKWWSNNILYPKCERWTSIRKKCSAKRLLEYCLFSYITISINLKNHLYHVEVIAFNYFKQFEASYWTWNELSSSKQSLCVILVWTGVAFHSSSITAQPASSNWGAHCLLWSPMILLGSGVKGQACILYALTADQYCIKKVHGAQILMNEHV